MASIEAVDFWAELFQMVDKWDWASIVQFILNGMIEGIVGILLIFFSLSVGQLFKDHRLLFAILTYVGISILTFVVAFSIALNSFEYGVTYLGINPVQVLVTIILGFGYYFGTYYILTKKLNLQ